MESYHEDTYGEHIAEIYDEWYAGYDDAAIESLFELAGGGRALELGIGTGRIALPLQQKGMTVHGIDASPAMLSKLRRKPDGDKIEVTIGNFADVAVDGKYAVIYIVFNTFFGLLTQTEQVRCLRNVAQHLEPMGSFVVEAFVPDLARFTRQQALRVVSLDGNGVRIDASKIDPVAQQLTVQHVRLTEQGVQLYPVKLRYVWASELDLMAQLAGLELKHRWGNWDRSVFNAESGKHISVYGHLP